MRTKSFLRSDFLEYIKLCLIYYEKDVDMGQVYIRLVAKQIRYRYATTVFRHSPQNAR